MQGGAEGRSMEMLDAMVDLWRLCPPGPHNILSAPAFVRLREACRDARGRNRMPIVLAQNDELPKFSCSYHHVGRGQKLNAETQKNGQRF